MRWSWFWAPVGGQWPTIPDTQWATEMGFTLFSSAEADEFSVTHVSGSACCAPVVNREKTDDKGCCQRCAQSGECQAFVWQPSARECWLLKATRVSNPLDITRRTAVDRLLGVRALSKKSGALAPQAGPLVMGVPFGTWQDLGRILSTLHPAGAMGVLLGVGPGEKAAYFLDTWARAALYLVDPYIHIWKGYDSDANVSDREHQMIYERLRGHLETQPRFAGRFSFAREFSFSFSRMWREKGWEPRPSFLWVDNNPTYKAVKLDLEEWWPLMTAASVLAGPKHAAVAPAVEEFAQLHGLQLFEAPHDDPPTWLLIKPAQLEGNHPRLEL